MNRVRDDNTRPKVKIVKLKLMYFSIYRIQND